MGIDIVRTMHVSIVQQVLRRSTYTNFRDKLYVCLGSGDSRTVEAYELKLEECVPFRMQPCYFNSVLCRLTMDFGYDLLYEAT